MGSTAAQKKARIGFDYVHSVVDDHSRNRVLRDPPPTSKATPAPRSSPRALAAYVALGITVAELMTDNHWSYTKSASLAELLTAQRIKHRLIRPHCPWQNGKVERFQPHAPKRVGLPTGLHHQHRAQRRAAPWIEHYNTQRRHSALGGLPDQPTVTNLMAGYI